MTRRNASRAHEPSPPLDLACDDCKPSRIREVPAVPASSARNAAARQRHVLHVFPTFEVGGVQVRMATVLNHFGDRFRHTIVSLDRRFDAQTRLAPELAVAFETAGTAHASGAVGSVRHARRMLQHLRPDMLLTYNWGSIEWALANRLFPTCRHIHLESGFGPEEADGQLRRRIWFRRLALARTSRIVVPSHTLFDIATRIWGVSRDRVIVIPNGVDGSRFVGHPGATLPCPALGSFAGCVVGTVAPLRPEKNVGRLIRAFSAIEADAALLVVGDGPQRDALVAQTRDLGVADRTAFTGTIDAIETAYPWMDVFVLASDTEQMPNALIQAMASARPIVAVDVGDVRRILLPENREFVVDRSNEYGLAQAIGRLVSDPALRARLGARNREHALATFDLDTMLGAYARVLGS